MLSCSTGQINILISLRILIRSYFSFEVIFCVAYLEFLLHVPFFPQSNTYLCIGLIDCSLRPAYGLAPLDETRRWQLSFETTETRVDFCFEISTHAFPSFYLIKTHNFAKGWWLLRHGC